MLHTCGENVATGFVGTGVEVNIDEKTLTVVGALHFNIKFGNFTLFWAGSCCTCKRKHLKACSTCYSAMFMASPLTLMQKLAENNLRDATLTTTCESSCRTSEQMGEEHGKREQAVSD